MLVSEKGTVLRVFTCREKDSNGKKLESIKGYIVDYLVVDKDDKGNVITFVKNTYIRSDMNVDISSVKLFCVYVFSFNFTGSKLFFESITPVDKGSIKTINIEV